MIEKRMGSTCLVTTYVLRLTYPMGVGVLLLRCEILVEGYLMCCGSGM
jgi:hypothetical protein